MPGPGPDPDATRERGPRVGHDRTLTRLIAAEREFGRTGRAPADIDVRTRAELPASLARELAERRHEAGRALITAIRADLPAADRAGWGG